MKRKDSHYRVSRERRGKEFDIFRNQQTHLKSRYYNLVKRVSQPLLRHNFDYTRGIRKHKVLFGIKLQLRKLFERLFGRMKAHSFWHILKTQDVLSMGINEVR